MGSLAYSTIPPEVTPSCSDSAYYKTHLSNDLPLLHPIPLKWQAICLRFEERQILGHPEARPVEQDPQVAGGSEAAGVQRPVAV